MNSIKASIYQSAQIKAIEAFAEERFAISSETMMQRAGKAAIDFIIKRWPQAHHIAVLCGCGNNGGDGFLAARFAHERGIKVAIWQVGDSNKMTPATAAAYQACRALDIPITNNLESIHLQHCDLLIDAICGIGLHDELREELVLNLKKLERYALPILAIDVPTGVNADTGAILGTALKATATMTFIGLKVGLLTGPGVAYSGEIILNDLQLPSDLFTYLKPIAEKIQLNGYQKYLKPRTRDWHKGLSGHVLVIGGEMGFSGAPRLAALGALRVGAGLVTVATRPENAVTMNITYPELMCQGITTSDQLQPLIEKADVIIIGPGLGQLDWGQDLWSAVKNVKIPLVVDADALNILSTQPVRCDNWILTPHPGEAGRLLAISPTEIQNDRLTAAQRISGDYGGVCILKGAGTIVSQINALPAICDKGNPGMATPGMGDILSGVIGGLLSQGVPLNDAAKLGVYLHALAGDLASKEGERGTIATDLLPFLRRLVNPSNGN